MRYRFGSFLLDEDTLWRDGEDVRLQPLARTLLRLLLDHAGERVDSDVLTARLWPDTVVTSHSLDQLVHRVRTALDTEREHLLTFPGRGYGYFGEVEVERQQAPSVLSDASADALASLSVLTVPVDPADALALVGSEAALVELFAHGLLVREGARVSVSQPVDLSDARRDAARRRHAAHFLGAERLANLGRAELAEVLAAGRFRAEQGSGLATVELLNPVLARLGLEHLVEGVIEAGLSAGVDVGALYRHLAEVCGRTARYDEGFEALRAAEDAGDTHIEERLRIEAFIAHGAYDSERAERASRDLVARLRGRSSPTAPKVMRDLANLIAERGRLSEALVLAQEAVGVAEALGDEEAALRCRGGIGEIHMRRGAPELALPHFRAAARGAAASPVHHAWWLGWLGEACAAVGAVDVGLEHLDHAQARYDEADTAAGVVAITVQRGRVLLHARRLERAREVLDEAVEMARVERRPLSHALARSAQAVVSALEGRDGAWEDHRRAIDDIVGLEAEGVALMALLDWGEYATTHHAEVVLLARDLATRLGLTEETDLLRRLDALG